MDLELEGNVVLVTGGSDGLGRALCEGLVTEGARVAFCGRDEGRIAETTAALEKAGGDVLGLPADVTRREDLARLVESAVERWGRIDGLVNNAGRSNAKAVAETTDEDWDEDLQLKLYAAIRLTRLTLPHLRRSRGSIVNVLSIGGKAPGPRSTPTTVSRAAGMALTKALSKELGPDGIRVNAVLIGFVESGQWVRMSERTGTPLPQLYERMSADVPLGRVGRAEEFSDLATYLLSPRASYVSGVAINFDGGLAAVV